MHYYKFDIKLWALATRHLNPEEEGIYLRLINHYYDTEVGLPEDITQLLRRLQLSEYRDTVESILEEYFHLVDGHWKHAKCDVVLNDYHDKAEKNRENGKLGGRPKTNGDAGENPHGYPPKPNRFKKETQVKPKHNPNQELLITNQELDKKKVPKKKSSTFTRPTLDDIREHIQCKGYNVNPLKFFNHYESNGWKVGRNPMKSWTAALASWNSRNQENNNGRSTIESEVGRVASDIDAGIF